jgi:hypothetical protein
MKTATTTYLTATERSMVDMTGCSFVGQLPLYEIMAKALPMPVKLS